MNTAAIIQSSQLSRVGINRQELKNGSSVLVRVISDNGNGRYTGSVAGVRINLKSNHPLKLGSSFVATINAEKGTIYITPKETNITLDTPKVSLLNSDQIYKFLENLGVPGDKISLNLLQLFKQLEMKFDTSLINKFRNIAIKFKDKEKSASELLAILSDKKILEDEKEIYDLLQLLFFESDYDDAESKEGRNLLNRINSAKGKWFIFPLQMVEINNDKVIANGSIRLLYDDLENLKLGNLDIVTSKNRYLFNIVFVQKKIFTIRFNISTGNEEVFISKIKSKFPNVNIEWAEIEQLEGSACDFEPLQAFNGVI